MSADNVRKRIVELTKQHNTGEISTDDYMKEFAKLQKLLQENIYMETRVQPPERTPEVMSAQLSKGFREAGAVGYVREEAEKALQDLKQDEQYQDRTPQELEDLAYRRAVQRYEKKVLPRLATTTEFRKAIPATRFVSRIVDPVRGLVVDAKTGEIRKGTKAELLGQGLLRQVKYSPAELEPVGIGKEADQLRFQAQQELAAAEPLLNIPGMESEYFEKVQQAKEKQKRAKELQEEFEKDPKFKEVKTSGYVVESPIVEYGFGLLNTGSAALAPMVKGVQDFLGVAAPIRKDAGYKKTQIEGTLGQFLTNLSTRQGMYGQFQAQLLPRDAETDGVSALLLQEGALIPTILGVFSEFAAPITPLGIPSQFAQMTRLAGKLPKHLMRSAQKVELDTVLRAVDENKSIKDIQKELKREGKNVTPYTLRGKAAETIADVYATEKTLQHALKQPGATVGNAKDFAQHSPTVRSVLNGLDDTKPITVAVERIKDLTKSLKKLRPAGKAEVPALRRAYDIGEDVYSYITSNRKKKPRFDRTVVLRNVRGASLRTGAEDVTSKIQDYIKTTLERPLSKPERKDFANLVTREKTKSFTENVPAFIYESTRGAVSEVLRDNFLKNIPEDMIAVGRRVAVPVENVVKTPFRTNKKLQQYFKRRKELLKHTSEETPEGRIYTLTSESFNDLYTYFKKKASSRAYAVKRKMNEFEFNVLDNLVAEELGVDILDGVRLQEGSLTAELARLKGAQRGTLISPVKGQRSSFAIQLQGIANAIRIRFPKSRVASFLGKIPVEKSPQLARFERELEEASNMAFRQVESELTNVARIAKTPEQKVEQINTLFESFIQRGVDLKLNRMKGQAPREQQNLSNLDSSVRTEAVIGDRSVRVDIAEAKAKEQIKKELDRYVQREKELKEIYENNKKIIERKFLERQRELERRIENLILEEKIKLQEKIRATKDIKQKNVLRKQLEVVEKSPKITRQYKRMFDSLRSKVRSLLQKNDKQFNRLMNDIEKNFEQLKERETQISTRKEREIAKVEERVERLGEEFSKRKLLSGLSDRYGRDAVNNALESAGVNTYDDLLDVIDDMEKDMSLFVEQVFRATQWRTLINKFFINPDKSFVKTAQTPQFFLDRLRETGNLNKVFLIDDTVSYLEVGNILPVTIDNMKVVVDNIRELQPGLKKFGLATSPLKLSEDYTLPILELMVDIQRTENMQQAIDNFIVQDPDLLMKVGTTYNSVAGLDSIKSTAQALENNILSTLFNADTRNILSELDVRLLIEQCKEVLFNAAMRDVWISTSRDNQLAFVKTYLNNMIETKTVTAQIPQEVIRLYNNGVLKSKTFDKIRAKSEQVLGSLIQNLKDSSKYKKTMTPKIEEFKRRLPEVIAGMEQDYLLNLLADTTGKTTGLFRDQINEIYSYISRYGVSPEVVIKNFSMTQPTMDYIGNTNLALLYGSDFASTYDKVKDMFTNSPFLDRIKKAATFGAPNNQYAVQKILSSIGSFVSWAQRMSVSNMLYGVIQPSTRFSGFNRLTAPLIYLASVGYAGTKVSSLAKFSALSFGFGISEGARRLTGIKFKSFFDSNKYLYAPAGEIIISSKNSNAARDYTAGELRKITTESGLEYSRSSAEFYDDQYKALLSTLKMTPQGKFRGKVGSTLVSAKDQLLGQSNIYADFAHIQDAELRRNVFIEALKNGESVEESVNLARQSMLDYTSLSRQEKVFVSKFVRFYAFMRTMGVATINNFYRAATGDSLGSISARLLKQQVALTKESSQDMVEMTDEQLGRIYNVWAGTVDDVDLYISGPPNPQMQAFELVSMLPLFTMSALVDDRPLESGEADIESSVWSTINAMTSLALGSTEEAITATPIVDVFLSYSAAQKAGRAQRSFPKEFIYAAEQQGILDDVIKRYGLVIRDRTPGRPLTEEGKYYSFARGSAGLKGFNQYLLDRLIGAYTLPALLTMTNPKAVAMQTRATSEYWKMRMLAEGVQDPQDRAKYLKSATIQRDLGMSQNILSAMYMFGLVTPTQSKNKKIIIDYAMRDALRFQKELKGQDTNVAQ